MKHTMKAEFGRVAMIRMTCPRCNSPALVIGGEMACCGAKVEKPDEYKTKKREVEGDKKRRHLSKKQKDKLVFDQNGLCFYCQQPFGTPVWHPKRHKVVIPGLVFDHFVCWDFSRNSDVGNMVASCSICNGIKGDKMFVNADEARAYIRHRFGQKGYEYDFPRE